MDWTRKFKPEYDYARGWIKNEAAFEKDWQPIVKGLAKLMTDTGFDVAEADSLTKLRAKLKLGAPGLPGHNSPTEDMAILQAIGALGPKGVVTLDADRKMRAAALKMLRHVYLLSKAGNRHVWVHSLPKVFTDWPSDHIHANGTTPGALKTILRSKREQFTEANKRHLSYATQHALSWCHRTTMLLTSAASTGKNAKKRDASRAIVKRWFADPGTSESDLDTYIGNLTRGFKDITGMLNRGQFILTDWVPLRGATAAGDVEFLNAEAFTFRSNAEGLDVVYVEQSFFAKHAGNVLHGPKNWTRIVVHELTHLVCGTEDVNIGNARYAWYGIGPHAGFPGSAAIRNADSWAFFCADCAGALTDSERKTALKIV
jgi:hypothetical protein